MTVLPCSLPFTLPMGPGAHFSSTWGLNSVVGEPVSGLFPNCCLDFLDWSRTWLVILLHLILTGLLMGPVAVTAQLSCSWSALGQCRDCLACAGVSLAPGTLLRSNSCSSLTQIRVLSFSNFLSLKTTSEKKGRPKRVGCVSSAC